MSDTYIVSMEWVKDQIAKENVGEQVRLIDCRFVLGQPEIGKQDYRKEHLPGAFHFDLDQDLASSVQTHGGRHPLPDLEKFAELLGETGIDDTLTVVAYDDQGGMMASRLWWMLHYLGHPKVYVMDGGFSQWKGNGYPVTRELPAPVKKRTFRIRLQRDAVVPMEEVKAKLGKAGTVLIDSREEKRYLGIEEPIDRVAGHIPGAVNYFWKESLNPEGFWKTVDEQKKRFQDLNPADEVIVYCGSGVSACPNILALKQAGFPNVRLYAGSWSDWITYPENPVANGKEQ
ncbi:thiosulfate sulfurtransferase [Effusibacillus dendaii]|uniref:Thiosulfate sulfurtransferase n=2 Tax=Effusibacillus dendaii TaxID=2743772 RepID=A0A7I8DFH3_9BACL|nr:thiosulfate sulfurtransferase [Effusibacillus dendaii]